jgi:hypothetical protein
MREISCRVLRLLLQQVTELLVQPLARTRSTVGAYLSTIQYERIHHRLRVLAGHLHQHHVPSLTLHERRNLAAAASEHQITFPVPWYRPIFDGGRTLADRNGISDLPVHVGLLGVVA